jgi:hypothetical protein
MVDIVNESIDLGLNASEMYLLFQRLFPDDEELAPVETKLIL